MAAVEMTLSQVMDQITLTEKRLKDAIASGTFRGVVVGEGKLPTNKFATKDALVAAIQSTNDRIAALMQNRLKLRRALCEANYAAKVVINGETISVMDALDYKTQLTFMRDLSKAQVLAFGATDADLRTADKRRTDELRTRQASYNGSTEGENYAKFVETTTKSVDSTHFPELVDPFKLSDQIKALTKDIEEIELTLKYKLTEVNAGTKITIDLVEV